MTIPTTAAQFILMVVVALPGVVFATSRIRARGVRANDVTLSSRIMHGIVAGVALDLVYLSIFGDRLAAAFLLVDDRLPSVRAAAVYTLTLGIVVPAATAWVLHTPMSWVPPEHGWLAKVKPTVQRVRKWTSDNVAKRFGRTSLVRRFSPTPTAWDFAVPGMGQRLVRIETVDGKFLGGWFADNSFIATYPESHDIYVEHQYRMSAKGKFIKSVPGTDGFWYSVRPGDTIDWINPDKLETQDSCETEPGGSDEQ